MRGLGKMTSKLLLGMPICYLFLQVRHKLLNTLPLCKVGGRFNKEKKAALWPALLPCFMVVCKLPDTPGQITEWASVKINCASEKFDWM